jgi:hypothetical protein
MGILSFEFDCCGGYAAQSRTALIQSDSPSFLEGERRHCSHQLVDTSVTVVFSLKHCSGIILHEDIEMFWRDSVELALKNLGGSASLDQLYDEVHAIRLSHEDTLPTSFKAIVRRELEYNSTDSTNWRGDRDLFYSVHGIGMGVWGLRSIISEPPVAIDIEPPNPTRGTARSEITTNRIIRDTKMTKKVKALHNHMCQICGDFIELPNGKRYVEAHHIIPLGTPHNGPDTPENIVVVCPNHHAMLDFGCVALSKSLLKAAVGHSISDLSISYHNKSVVGSA